MLPDMDTLVILSPGFPKDEADTTCLPLQQQLVKSMQQLYPDVQLLVLAFQYPFHQQEYTWHGVRMKAFGGRSKGHVFKWYNQMQIGKEFKAIQQTHKVIGILSFWLGECAFVGERFSRRYNLKHYCWVLGQDAKPGNAYVTRADISGRSLIALSDFIARSIHTNYGLIPRHTIPGGIEPSCFGDQPSERDIDILGVGSLIPLKQHHVFVEIIGMLRQKFPAIKAMICGDGPGKDRLIALIAEQGLQSNITLAGEIPHPEVLRTMQRAKILLHTSEYEGLGMVCLEALFAGAKVVSFTKPFNDAIPNWHIVADAAQAVDTISNILSDTANSYQSVIPFHADEMAENMLALYREILPATDRNRAAIALKERVEL